MPTTTTHANHLDQVWAKLTPADRHALLGHVRDELTPADRIRLALTAAALRRSRRGR